jgi:hypothetical protein
MTTKKKATKKVAKKVAKVGTRKATPKKSPVSTEIVLRVEQAPAVPTVSDLSEPMRDGKNITLTKTWVGEKQLLQILQKTPKQYVYRKPGKGGGTFDYVSVAYITKALNYIFGWNWDFEVLEHGVEGGQVWVKGKLTVHGMQAGQTISKTQFGRADIKYKRGTKEMLDFGNDLKGATSDALKKCASMFGIASDIYGKSEYKEESGNEPRQAPAAKDEQQAAPEEVPTVAPGEPYKFEDHICQWSGRGGCGVDITKAEAEYTKRMFGRELCKNHHPKK